MVSESRPADQIPIHAIAEGEGVPIMSSLCDTCAKRMKEITYVGLSTVAWTGKYVCTPYNNAPTLPDVVKECKGYVPKKKGQMSLEAFA